MRKFGSKGGTDLFTRKTDSSVTVRLLTVAASLAVATGLSGSGVASAVTTGPASLMAGAASYSRQVVAAADPVDSAVIRSLPESPLVFNVSANSGVPWIRDPRSSPTWQNLRRIPGSGGGYVTAITVAEDSRLNYTPDSTTTSALRVTARTAAGIYFTVCRLGNLQSLSIPLPATGNLPCTPWAAVPN